MTALWEMDLSPGITSVPRRPVCFLISILLPTVHIQYNFFFSEERRRASWRPPHKIQFSAEEQSLW